jgi:glycosyltransferase involved in cell wall biosynthesis
MKITQPLVCICIPTFNSENTIRQAIESLLLQKYKNLKIKIVDNYSNDSTIEIVKTFRDSRIELHQFNTVVPVIDSFNRCLTLLDGDYSAIFHADDLYLPDLISEQVNYLEMNPGAGAVFTEAVLINNLGKKIGQIKLPAGMLTKSKPYDFIFIFKKILRHYNFIVCPSALIRTNIYKNEIGEWDGYKFRSSADLDVWLRILQHHSIGFLGPLMKYRISSIQESEVVRKNLNRSDFFSVIDYYLSFEQIRNQISQTDLQSYKWLELRDKLRRYINYISIGEDIPPEVLINDIWHLKSIISAFNSRQGISTLFFGSFVMLSTLFFSKVYSKHLILKTAKILNMN